MIKKVLFLICIVFSYNACNEIQQDSNFQERTINNIETDNEIVKEMSGISILINGFELEFSKEWGAPKKDDQGLITVKKQCDSIPCPFLAFQRENFSEPWGNSYDYINYWRETVRETGFDVKIQKIYYEDNYTKCEYEVTLPENENSIRSLKGIVYVYLEGRVANVFTFTGPNGERSGEIFDLETIEIMSKNL